MREHRESWMLVLRTVAVTFGLLWAASAYGQQTDLNDEAPYRPGAGGLVQAGAVLWNIDARLVLMPEVTIGFGGQTRNISAYLLVSGGTGQAESGLRITMTSAGVMLQTAPARVRFGVAPVVYMWFLERVSRAASPSIHSGAGLRASVSIDVVRWSNGEFYVDLGGTAALIGAALEAGAGRAHLGIRF